MVACANVRVATAVALLLASGCKPSVADADARDRETPSFDRAVRDEQSGKLDEAIAQYEQVLLDHPRLFSAHLHLALLLHDHQQDYFGAIYHYKQYLKLRPGGEKDDLVEGRIRLAEQLLAGQLLRRIGDIAGIAESRLTSELDALNKRVAILEGEKASLVEEKDKLITALQTSQGETQRLRRLLESMRLPDSETPPEKTHTRARSPLLPVRDMPVDIQPAAAAPPSLSRSAIATAREEAARMVGEPAAPPATPLNASQPAAAAPSPAAVSADPAEPPPRPAAGVVEAKRPPALRTYVVQPGDTLYGISERHYGDGTKWTTVRDANKSRIGSDGRVRAGQILLIP